MKGVTGGSLPAAIWKRFVSAATPLVGRMSEPAVAEAARSAAPTKQAQCDQNACAAAYNSFRPSDCTYQPYDGSRRLCDKGGPRQDRTVAGNNARPLPLTDASTREGRKASPDDRASGVRPGDDLSATAMSPEQRSRRAQGRMALGSPEAVPSERAPGQHQTVTQPRAFGPAIFKNSGSF
jgi:membrane peptidoglycan carboxypeptidase